MPAGVPWGEYMRFFVTAFASMAAGAQIVHIYYKPLEDMEELVLVYKQRLRSQAKIASDGIEQVKAIQKNTLQVGNSSENVENNSITGDSNVS